jgi:hypothetical protein
LLSRYANFPNTQVILVWIIGKKIIKVLGYLKRTTHFELYYNNFPIVLEGYTDASRISSAGDNKSTFKWVFILRGGVVSWALEKQTYITRFIIKSEFIALIATW